MYFQGLISKVLDVLESYIEGRLEIDLDDKEINLFQFDELLQHPTESRIVAGFENMQDNLRDLDISDLDDLLSQLRINSIGNQNDSKIDRINTIEDYISKELNKAQIEYKLPE